MRFKLKRQIASVNYEQSVLVAFENAGSAGDPSGPTQANIVKEVFCRFTEKNENKQ